MRTIYKYEISLEAHINKIRMPENAVMLSFQEQGGKLFLWCLIDTDKPERDYDFYVLGTGWTLDAMAYGSVPKYIKHVGTVQQNAFVWHLFVDTLVK